jgi:enoyl-CoA hydratase
MSEAPAVLFEAADGVGVLSLNRPDKFNCLNDVVVDGMTAAMDAFEADDTVRAVLVRAEGENFCTGADLEAVKSMRSDANALAGFLRRGHAVLNRMEASDLPVIAAVQGLCLAGGIEVMLACDMVIAARSARIGDQHARFGLVPGWGGSQRLPRAVGMRRALDLMFSARWLDAVTAEAWGLVNQVADDDKLDDEARAFCADLAAKSAAGLGLMKRLARDGLGLSLADGLALEIERASAHLIGHDALEGLSAFEERREPEFE